MNKNNLKTKKSTSSRPPYYSTCEGVKDRLRNDPGYRHVAILRRWYESPATMARDLMAMLGTRPDGFTLDRINPRAGYWPGNVRWSSDEVQHQNRVAVVQLSLPVGQVFEIVFPQDLMSAAERKWRHAKFRKVKRANEREWRKRNRDRYLAQQREYRRKQKALKKTGSKSLYRELLGATIRTISARTSNSTSKTK